MGQHITVVDYNPLWVKKYEEESVLIKDILADNCIVTYHIGSTSVPGLAAKPIIDIMVVVRSLDYDIDGYCDGKESFVREIEKVALVQFDESWEEMYIAARKVQKKRALSSSVEAGSVSAALLTEKGNIYVGVCIDTACSLGMCAERNAIANMITNGEDSIRRVIAVDWNGKAIPPCGACREFMTQLMPENYRSIEIMLNYEKQKVVTLGELTPEWWI